MFDIDLLAFAGNVALTDTSDLVQAHALVYKHPLTPHLRGTDGDDRQARILRKRASDAYYSTLYLPYFSIKPMYVLAMEAAHKVGANVVDASRIVSAICFLGIAVAVWAYVPSALAVVILILPESMVLGQANDPDGMSVMFLLVGLWLLFIKDVKLGILPLLVAVWVRPDNSVLCVTVLALLWILGQLNWRETAVLFALIVGSNLLISHFGDSWRALYFHTFLGGEPGQLARFTGTDYLHALASGINEALHASALIYALFWAVCFIRSRDRRLRRILGVVAVSSAAHFVIFPNYEPRYYGLFFILTAAAAVRLILDSGDKRPMAQRAF